MKIFSSEQIRELDNYTIRHEPILSIELMERSCWAIMDWFTQKYGNAQKVKIFCGMGNNGGDGLGIARLLMEKGFTVKVYIVQHTATGSEDFKNNLKRVQVVKWIRVATDMPKFNENDVIIDAIFGSGLNRPVDGVASEVISEINKSGNTVVSIDIASGLYADKHSGHSHIVEPDYTVSFQCPKLAFFLPENEKYTGEWEILDIGLHKSYIEEATTFYHFSDTIFVKGFFKKRAKFSHKGNYGHALLIAGSYGKIGALVMASRACLRSGVGLLTVHSPGCGYEIVQTTIPEAMVETDNSKDFISQLIDIEKYTTIGIGPGIGVHPLTCEVFEQLLKEIKKPVVIDADGLNILSQFKSLMYNVPENSILTPHPKEFERLTGSITKDNFERLEILRGFVQKYKVIVVLKGSHTAVALPNGEIHFNGTGNPGMATGGSGDVLTGILTSLLAQGYLPHEAAILGVHIHGLAGDKAAGEKGFSGLIASDIIEAIPLAMKEFELPEKRK